MNKKILKSILLCMVMLFCAMPLQASAKTVLVLADSGWDSQRLHVAMAQLIIENAYDGYKIKKSTASTPMNWQALLAGDVDLDMETWASNIVTFDKDLKNGDAVEIGVSTPDSAQGLYVPRYVIEGDAKRGIKPMAPNLKTVKDLAKYPKVFPDDEDKSKGRIYGSTPGWMADEILHKKYELYGLDKNYNYVRLGSDSTLFASLVSAYNLGEAWVGYCFEPTVVSGKLDIVKLEDEPYESELFHKGGTEFNPEKLRIMGSRYLAKKAPDLIGFLKKYRLDSAMVAKGLAYIDEKKTTHEETAKWMLKTHPKLLSEWLPKDKADKVRAIL